MAKDSQLDSKSVRKAKTNGGATASKSADDNGKNNRKKQSGNRHKPDSDN